MIKTLNYFINKYKTTCPFQLCKELDINVICRKLTGVNGIASNNFNRYLIILNEDLSEADSKFTLAHELGHILLGHDLNILFLSNYTLQVTNKYENEANSFATLLLIKNYIEFSDFEVLTLDNISNITGIPVNIVVKNEKYIKEMLK